VNYRHAFHAGNFADVHKHLVLLALLERLQRKPKPLFYLDTHAGRGWYDLTSAAALRSNEWQAGIARLAGLGPASEELRRYLDAVHASRDVSQSPLERYPGSPILAIGQLRAQDRVVLVEQQIQEAQALEDATARRRDVSIVCGDGYAAMKTYLPPRENRGLVLIDPPYESESEFEQARQALQFGLKRWPNGMFALWYPIKAGGDGARLHSALRASPLRKLLSLELLVRPLDSRLGLNGSGLILANPPWQFETQILPALEETAAALAPGGVGRAHVEWLVEE
jgi:23S rRNA (adenine2030-N6)-methyltransferase